MKVLVLAHPRSGTGYTAHCFRQCGWDVGHEYVRRDGIASWMWAVPWAFDVPWGDAPCGMPHPETVLHVMRDPAECVSSVVYTEGTTEAWRARFVQIPDACKAVERAVWSIYGWSYLIEKTNPTHRTRLDDVERIVGEITGTAKFATNPAWLNARAHPHIGADEIKATVWIHPETARMWDGITAAYEGAMR